jgi:pimeloyl-ACP methyl ester carboxylesterase
MRNILLVALIVLIAAASYISVIYTHTMTAAHTRLTGHSKTIETSFGTMEYALMGQGDPMLIVHGAGGGFDQGLDMTGAMAAHGYQLIAPSRFGYLRSAMPGNPTTAMQADAFAQLLDKLGIDKVVVVGISAGAWSALQFAIRHPERCQALVLLVPADYLPAGTSIHGGAVVRAIFNSDFVAWTALKLMPVIPGMTRMMLATDPSVVRAASPDEKARVAQILDHLLPVSPRIAGMNFDIETAANREPYSLDKIVSPLLAISAEDDGFGTASRARNIAAAVPNGRTIVFPTGGHALVGHHADALSESIAFLQQTQ